MDNWLISEFGFLGFLRYSFFSLHDCSNFQGYFVLPVQKPSIKTAKSHKRAGAPSKDFEELHPDNQLRRTKKFLDESDMSIIELLEAARVKAEREGLSDASKILKALSSNPIEEGQKIKEAVDAHHRNGRIV